MQFIMCPLPYFSFPVAQIINKLKKQFCLVRQINHINMRYI